MTDNLIHNKLKIGKYMQTQKEAACY